jgi:hypothetical protein
MIRYLKHHEINKEKWDEAIRNSLQQSLYAVSWYLDCVSPQWCALVEDDYLSVMPLPIKRKWGVPLITQPVLCQQLGIFFNDHSIITDYNRWLNVIPKKHILLRLSFNVENAKILSLKGVERINYQLSLQQNYDEINLAYSNDCKRNIAKALNKKLCTKEVSIDDAFIFFEQNDSLFNNPLYRHIFTTIKWKGQLYILGVYENEELLSTAFFMKSYSSYIYIAACTNEKGRKQAANYLLIDSFVRYNCKTDTILDFEGSSIASIAKFFAGFGAKSQTYIQIKKWNLL